MRRHRSRTRQAEFGRDSRNAGVLARTGQDRRVDNTGDAKGRAQATHQKNMYRLPATLASFSCFHHKPGCQLPDQSAFPFFGFIPAGTATPTLRVARQDRLKAGDHLEYFQAGADR